MAENLYKHDFWLLKAEILNIPGIKYNKNGSINEVIKLMIESLIR